MATKFFDFFQIHVLQSLNLYLLHQFQHQEVLGFQFPATLLGQSKSSSTVYFVDGLLIDTGHSKKCTDVMESIEQLSIDQVFLTHHHEDHTGNIHEIHARFNPVVYSSPQCAEMMQSPPELTFVQKVYWGSRASFQQITPIEKILETKNHQFQLIPVSGHAPDMVVLYEPEREWLFSADLFINTRIGYFISDESIKAEIESIQRILMLEFDVLFCGHNPQLKNGKSKLQEKLNYLEDFTVKVLRLYEKGYSNRAIFKELKLKELRMLKLFSGGYLSKMNMVESVIRDFGA